MLLSAKRNISPFDARKEVCYKSQDAYEINMRQRRNFSVSQVDDFSNTSREQQIKYNSR